MSKYTENRIKHFINISAGDTTVKHWQQVADDLMFAHQVDDNPEDAHRLIANQALPSLIHQLENLEYLLRDATGGANAMFAALYPDAVKGGMKRCPPIPMLDGGCEECCTDVDIAYCHTEWYIDKAARDRVRAEEAHAAKREQHERDEYARLKHKFEEASHE